MTRVHTLRRRRESAARTAAMHAGSYRLLWLGSLAALAAVLWAYWRALVPLWKDWQQSEEYSVGQLVPLVAVYLVWHQRKALRELPIAPCWWGGLLILLGQLARGYGLLFLFESAERYSIVITLAGLVLLIFGWPVFRKLAWVLLFMFLMVPLPGRIHNLISGPLQTQAASGAVFLLELFGVHIVREGNTLVLNDSVPLAVAEACSGLRMLTAFMVVSATLAFMVHRPRWQKAVLVLSSIPVAVACNLLRLLVTALLYLWTSNETAERFFHDFAGLAMMPAALLILYGEMILMKKLVIPEGQAPDRPTVRVKAEVDGSA